MGMLGNKLQSAYTATVKDTRSGDGSTTIFTLSKPSRTNDVDVFVENVRQEPTVAYSVSGTTLTFTAAPATGTDNIYVIHRVQASQSLAVNTDDITDGAITADKIAVGAVTDPTPSAVSGQANTATDFFALPSGTTAERPGSPANGYIRYNTDTNQFEIYQANTWTNYVISYTVETLAIAGGGGGGTADTDAYYGGGGGGAGGLVYTSGVAVTSGASITVTVGGGGAGGTSGNRGTLGEGSDVVGVSSATALGGGGGGSYNTNQAQGGSGGSGGGSRPAPGGLPGGAGTSGQGNDGGSVSSDAGGSGGGGAGAAGQSITSYDGGNGGIGLNTYSAWATATSTGDSGYYAGGGGGGAYLSNTGGSGGTGGGGAGSTQNVVPTAGSANTGGGGGGGGSYEAGANGGKGIVIIRYAGSQIGTGGTVVSSGGYTYHTFTSSGTYTA